MKTSRYFFAIIGLTLGMRHAGAEPAARWITSTEKERWKELPLVSSAAQPSAPAVIHVDPGATYQVIDGFGGCFNDLGWQALLALDESKRDVILKELFDPHGANFTLGRVPIGANDFALTWYSLDEMPGDYALKDFSIERDRRELIPYIKAAMKYQPGLGVWGVPWSPPSWMTTNGNYRGGRLKQDSQTLSAYALYFSKFVQAYRADGIRLFAIMPQNEPVFNENVYPQCKWTGKELDTFLRDYLAPRLKQDNITIEVWLGTLALLRPSLADFTDPVLGDPVTNPSITGVGYQYLGQSVLKQTHDKYPDKKLAQTETECYHGENTWAQGMITFSKMVEDMNNYAGSYYYWNLVLNETETSTWNWRQNSLVTIDRTAGTFRYNPEFYAMKHFSATVLPGAKRIGVSGGSFKNIAAFINPSGSEVIVFANEDSRPVSGMLKAGESLVKFNAPARSMNTILLDGNGGGDNQPKSEGHHP